MLNDPEHAVETLIKQGAPLDRIEEHINRLPVDGDYRSALWLLAWVKAGTPAPQRLSRR